MSELILIRRGSRLRHDSLLQEFEIAAVGHDAATLCTSKRRRGEAAGKLGFLNQTLTAQNAQRQPIRSN